MYYSMNISFVVFRRVEILDVSTLEVGVCSDDCTSEWTFVYKRPDICSFSLLVIGYLRYVDVCTVLEAF